MLPRARRSAPLALAATLAAAAAALHAPPARAQVPVSLDQVPVPEPRNLARFVQDRAAAVRLGKALFWDMQLGSDGLTACASCHFAAGTDHRTRNTVHPRAGGFGEGGRANGDLALDDFPFHRLADPDDRFSPRLRSRDDVVGAQGVPRTLFQAIVAGRGEERGRTVRDPVFGDAARNVRQVTARNAPSVVNAVFNLVSFHDGRARQAFNGVNAFGDMDPSARVLEHVDGALVPRSLVADPGSNPYALDAASLASQAVAPPANDVEMSWVGRTWPEIGRKLLPLAPLARQEVHPADSALAALRHPSGRGLATTYAALVRAAFRPEWWDGPAAPDGAQHMEANFALFFGLAVQLYEATLVSDDTPFDRFLRGNPAALTPRQVAGMTTFFSPGAGCVFCHTGPELTAATRTQLLAPGEPGFIEVMAMGDGQAGAYDIGFYNIGVRPSAEDPGRGGRVELGGRSLPLSFTEQFIEDRDPVLGPLPFPPLAQPGCVSDPFGEPPNVCPPPGAGVPRAAVAGAFKVPGLRNVELTGPYMHNGGMATLLQVVDFYVRGGDFHEENLAALDPLVSGIRGLAGDDERKRELVDFLLALTDERVRDERAPFDHPQLLVADGHELRVAGDPKRTRRLADRLREIPAVGAGGRTAQGLPPVRPFLSGEAADPGFHFRR